MPTPIAQRSTSTLPSTETAAIAAHCAKLGDHLAAVGKLAEAVVARRLAERLRAIPAPRRRLP